MEREKKIKKAVHKHTTDLQRIDMFTRNGEREIKNNLFTNIQPIFSVLTNAHKMENEKTKKRKIWKTGAEVETKNYKRK